MVRAFGYCNDVFDPVSPGRLCRGRERWIGGLPDVESTTLHRTVLSGAVFSDDSARDARRGLRHSGVSAAKLLQALFPKHDVIGWCETGDPRALPAKMLLEEDYTRAWQGGLRSGPAVRWAAPVPTDALDAWMDGDVDGLACPRADAFVLTRGKLTDALINALFLLTGYGDPDDRPARNFCPTALPDVLAECDAVALMHLDKHASVLALYTVDPLEADDTLRRVATEAGAFPVPFAIPPMLARWDRALYELRLDWDTERDGEFPVPPAEDAGGRWSARSRRRREEQAGGEE